MVGRRRSQMMTTVTAQMAPYCSNDNLPCRKRASQDIASGRCCVQDRYGKTYIVCGCLGQDGC